MNRVWRNVRFTVCWTITAADETAIDRVPADAWTDSLNQDGTATGDAHVAELTGLNTRLAGWTGTLRLLVRRTKPSAGHVKNLTALEKRTGWRYQIVATNVTYHRAGARLASAAMARCFTSRARRSGRSRPACQGHGTA